MSGVLLLVAALALSPPPTAGNPRPGPDPLHVSSGAGAAGSAGTALYRAPSTYREPGRPTRNSVIITSQPVRIGQQLSLAGLAGAAQPPPPPPPEGPATPATWRRQLFVRTTLGTDGAALLPSVHVSTSSTALGVGGAGGGARDPGASSAPVVAIDCADGKSCSTTIPVRPPAATHSPTFKPYSQEVLDKFLSDYATVTTAGNGSDPLGGGKDLLLQLQEQQQRQRESAGSQGPAGAAEGADLEPTNRLANLYLEEGGDAGGADGNGTEDKSKSVQWSLLKSQHHKHPYDDHKGWVTLEPVPWSSSHVSKWQSNVQPGRPWDNSPSPSSWHNDIEQRPGGYGPPPHNPGPGPGPSHGPGHGPGHGPNSGYHHGQSTQNFNGNGNGNNWPTGGSGSGGSPSRPSSWNEGPGWDLERPGPSQDYRPERPGLSRPSSWESQRPNKWERPGPAAEQWGGGGGSDSDIITDNSPPDFPSHPGHPGQQGPPGRPGGGSGGGSYSYGQGGPGPSNRPWGNDRPHREPGRHPATHPDEGDGTWVLLSSTKGYSTPPRGRLPHQRALTVSTHRSVRLTVLPPENGTNMTTSHGGLLEVEDTQHTVDESQRLHAAALLKQALDQHHNATLSSYETLVREATRAHEAQLLKQALADKRLANATAMSPELLQQAQQAQLAQQADKRADNHTAAAAAPPHHVPSKTKSSKSRTKIRIEPLPSLPLPHRGDSFTGRGEGAGSAAANAGSAMALKVVRPATPSRRSMALAAVGAGLLPATMAMLVPIMLGKRRRRSLDDDEAAARDAVKAAAPPPSYPAYAPYTQDQPLEAEDSPPRVIDYRPSASAWARPRRRRESPGSGGGSGSGSRV